MRKALTYTERLARGLAQILNDADGRKAMTTLKMLTEQDDGDSTKQTLTFGPFTMMRTVHKKTGKSLPSTILMEGSELADDPGLDVVKKIEQELGPIIEASENARLNVEGLPPDYNPELEEGRRRFNKKTLEALVKDIEKAGVRVCIARGDVKVTPLS